MASDVSAVLEHTNNVLYVENGDVVTLTAKGVTITNLAGKEIKRKPEKITWDITQAKKGGFDHYMMKEIFEQPSILSAILKERISGSTIHFDELKISPAKLNKNAAYPPKQSRTFKT